MSISAAPEVSKLSVSLGLCWMVEFEHATTQTTGDSEPLNAEELKVMAQALRLGGAASIIPAKGPSHLPEMDCFSASWDCHRFRLWPRMLEEHPTPQTSIRLLPEDRCVSKHTGTDVPCTGLHTATTLSSSTSAGLTITAPRGLPIVPEDGLNFNYSKLILANDKKDRCLRQRRGHLDTQPLLVSRNGPKFLLVGRRLRCPRVVSEPILPKLL